MRFAPRSIGTKFLLALTLAISLLIFIFVGITISTNIRETDREVATLLDNTTKIAQASLAVPLWNFDQYTLNETAQAFLLNPSISYIRVISNNETLVEEFNPEYAGKNFTFFVNSDSFSTTVVPIKYEDNAIGTIRLAISRKYFQKKLVSNIYRLMYLQIFLLVTLFVTVKVITTKYVQKPLARLQHSASAITHGDLETPVDVTTRDEIGDLGSEFDTMRKSLKTLFSALSDSGNQLLTTSEEITETAGVQGKTNKEFSELVHHIVASSNGISTTSQQLMTTMQNVYSIASNTTELADSGQHALEGMKQNMDKILNYSQVISGDLNTINEKSENIDTIITTLITIADRTNLLSLNANIEAQKAGKQGLGFRIVAKEINRLAEETAVNTMHIKEFIEEMQDAITTGVSSIETFTKDVLETAGEVTNVGSQMSTILDHIQTLAPQFNEVNEGVQFQTNEALEINKSLLQLREMTDKTVENLNKFMIALDQLKEASFKIQEEVSMKERA